MVPTEAVESTTSLLPTAQATDTPAPTPTVQVSAADHLQRGVHQQDDGNYEAASAEFRATLAADPTAEIAREALLRLGQSQLEAGAYQEASDALARLIATYPQDPEVPTAFFWLGRAREGLKDWQGAVDAYRHYLEHRPFMQTYVQERLGYSFAQAGDHAAASAAYRLAADGEPSATRKVRLLEGLATAERALKRYDRAVAAYDEILKVAQNSGYRAEILFETGAVLRDAGQTAEAAERWNQLVSMYPWTPQATQALPALDKWGLASVDALTRARVEYAAGRYAVALKVLGREITGNAAHTGEAHYYAALCHRKLGQHRDSVRELDLLINTHPLNALVPEAWYEKGESLVLLGQVDDAVTVFRQLATNYPQQGRAADGLWRVAQILESAGRTAEAGAAYGRVASSYPKSAYASNARFRAGFVHYLDGRPLEAARVWAGFLPHEAGAAMHARLLLWLGKAASAQNDQVGARERWTQATSADPGGFFGLRARDLLTARRFTGQAPEGAFDPQRYAPRGRPEEAENWLVGWAGAPAEGQAIPQLPAPLLAQEAFRRGMELWKLGEPAAANGELGRVEAAYRDDPHALYALSLYARDQGLYLLSIKTAQRVLDLAPAGAREQPPRLIEELIYPTYYAHLVLREAQPTNTDPLLFFALMRQESMFDRNATSYSDARGLAQVIPSTGKYIATQLGDAAYTPERLWRPEVSVRYGLWYFSRALGMFDDNALMALVGYNAGPGNAAAWSKLAGGDDDLYFERVSNAQPRAYMQKIYEHRAQYERLYR